MSHVTDTWLFTLLEIMSVVLITVIGFSLLAVIVMYIRDVTQTEQTIRRNYPVIGRFHYAFEHMGEFFWPILFCHGSGRAAF